jgi:hypothetical protein
MGAIRDETAALIEIDPGRAPTALSPRGLRALH